MQKTVMRRIVVRLIWKQKTRRAAKENIECELSIVRCVLSDV